MARRGAMAPTGAGVARDQGGDRRRLMDSKPAIRIIPSPPGRRLGYARRRRILPTPGRGARPHAGRPA
jgi:hypothetical protein